MKVNSFYKSISGEVSNIPQGSFVTILRLAGCNLNCSYCDAVDARNGIGEDYEVSSLIGKIKDFGIKNILITGGEPLLQYKAIDNLFSSFFGYNFIVETNGTINPNIMFHFHRINFVVDFKLPSSGHFSNMTYENFINLKSTDYIKFVCGSEEDFFMAMAIKTVLKAKGCNAKFAIGETWDSFEKRKLNIPNRLLEIGCTDFIVSVQLHKIIGLD